MLKLIARVAKKQTTLTVPEYSDFESENVPQTITSSPVKSITTTTNQNTTLVNSRNSAQKVIVLPSNCN